ncbi:SET domain-containing protein [Lentinus tigrinus ALCF2SS1-6]|uniref:SET domain-containing protein n=1 Tax=Lentinus tigrinus ALCF2SS1-6 TaxID=1328759 RepID=A0A5C2RX66_9APHY|nr:SET domain-containing protein [Lentinus tigrinus ALCF2SS1-6]
MEINQDICDVLKVFPDAPICKLALLCNADCRDVYYHRMMYLPNKNSTIPEQVIVDRKAPRAGAIQYLSDVCDHNGPCVPPLCICAIRQEWCNRRCGCFGRCGARKGCTCEDGKCLDNAEVNGDLSRLCPCIDAGWECSPELCAGVRNRRLKKNMKHACRSMYLQKDKKPTIVVKQATFGLGAFANGKIPAGTFLGEYIAEKYPLADEKIDRAVRRVNWHRGLNYMFSLNDDSGVLDAATVGDPTRCLNDSLNKDDLNVKAEPTTVDGDMRIYFWAFKDVKKDEELLLGYGEGYWANYFVSNTDEDEETLGDEDQVDADDEKDELEDGWRA